MHSSLDRHEPEYESCPEEKDKSEPRLRIKIARGKPEKIRKLHGRNSIPLLGFLASKEQRMQEVMMR
jgi:hypothetical protein